jgi:DnaJ-class molecular chaperone
MIECPSCEGSGGFDASRDIEVYDEWIDCEMCNGTGELEDC